MISDKERREIARKLRGLDYSDLQESLICAYLDALGIKGYEDWIGIAHRLADLIEPTIDRDALLALAEEMQRELNECVSDHEIAGNLQSQIDRIREALGVGDD